MVLKIKASPIASRIGSMDSQYQKYHLSLVVRNDRSSGFPTRSDTNRSVQSQKMVRGL